MTENRFSGLQLSDLGTGTGLAILGFRACAFGRQQCCRVASGFGAALGEEAGDTLSDLMALTVQVNHQGRRKIGLAGMGCLGVTHEEALIAKAFFATQALNERGAQSHLTTLLGREPTPQISLLMSRISDTFAGYGLAFGDPDAAQSSSKTSPSKHQNQSSD
ncbi:MAG: hypothetical protein AAF830_14970 [Pseudomonadota bacterium]